MYLVADIGGTNARFALVDENRVEPQHVRVLACADYHSLTDAVLAYVRDASIEMPATACIAIATAITSDRVSMTNHVWDFSISETRKQLKLNRLKVINDYTALSLSLPYLDNNDSVSVGAGSAVKNQTMAVIGPGTGLGVSGAVYTGEFWLPLQGEGGHVEYRPSSPREQAIFEVIYQRHHYVSAEIVVSGPGLVLLYEAVSELDGERAMLATPAQVTRLALDGESSAATEALDIFCGILGAVAGNLALTLGARGGVYIGGGIIPRMLDFFQASSFRDRFENKGRFTAYVSAIPTRVITSEYPALTGAAVAIRSHYQSLGITSTVDD